MVCFSKDWENWGIYKEKSYYFIGEKKNQYKISSSLTGGLSYLMKNLIVARVKLIKKIKLWANSN